ncbi:MAG: mandelate racemase/muconate lactonizing enzyme family protein [Trueperaceae bacterium]|nr:mandelate racemase/muconate lactonizing enzyme family protein [Trueperaceae bacterium]
MRIHSIHAVGLYGATPEGGWEVELRPDDCVHTLVAVLTEEGAVGYGSCFTSVDLVRAAFKVLEPLLLGEVATEPERVSEKLHQHTFWMGRGGTLTHAISGIDIALWDILGQVTGQSVARLLGGRYRERVRPYASLLMRDPELLADELRALVQSGFRAFKLGWGPFGRHGHALDEAIVRAARDAVGDGVDLMIDAGGSAAHWPHRYTWALRTAEMLAGYAVRWFEEPLAPDDIDGYALLREHSRVAIAGGEVLTRRQSFLPWFERRAFDIVQPDVTKVGGLSEQRRIAWSALDHGVDIIPHGWNTALGLAADLHLASALPHTDLVEYLTGSPYIDGIVTEPWLLDEDGMLAIPSGPGIGVSLDHEAVARFGRGDRLPVAS